MDHKEIEKALQDIHFVKEVISKDSTHLKKFLESRGLRYLTLFFGLAISLISFLAYFSFGRENNSIVLKWLLAAGIILLIIITGIMKWKIWNFLFPEKPWPSMLFKIIGLPVLKIVALILFLIIAFTIGLSVFSLYHYFLPVWALGCGILFSMYGSLFNVFVLEITGYFMTFGGSVSFFFIYNRPIEAWLWTGIIFGVAFLIYFIITTLSSLRRVKSE